MQATTWYSTLTEKTLSFDCPPIARKLLLSFWPHSIDACEKSSAAAAAAAAAAAESTTNDANLRGYHIVRGLQIIVTDGR